MLIIQLPSIIGITTDLKLLVSQYFKIEIITYLY